MNSKKIITPNQNLITPKKNQQPKIQNEVIFEPQVAIDYSSNVAYNDAILDHVEYVKCFVPRDNHVLIRVFKYEAEATSASGLILDNDVEWFSSEGGQMKVRRSENFYQTRAVVCRIGHIADVGPTLASKLEEGDIIRLSTNKLGEEFDTIPTKKGTKKEGYFLIHVGIIAGTENK